MMNPAEYFAAQVVRNSDLRQPEARKKVALVESWVSIIGNLLLAGLKLFFGLLTNSVALTADAIHSASDIFSSLAVLFGFVLAARKPDREHPYGHGRIEYLAGLVIAVMLVGAGILFSFDAYKRLVEQNYAEPSIAAIIVVIFSIFVKELMYYFAAHLGRLINSEALIGDAWHHRSDSLSSVLVLIALIGNYLGYYALDAYFGFLVAAFIIYAGYVIARQSCSRLLGKAPESDFQEEVIACIREIDGVIDTHDLEIHDYGAWKVVTAHINVKGSLSLEDAHDIANEVEKQISSCFHCNAVVHLDPG